MSGRLKKPNFGNPVVSAFYEGFLAGRHYGASIESGYERAKDLAEERNVRVDAEEEILAILHEIFEIQFEMTQDEDFWRCGDGVNRSDIIKRNKQKYWNMLEATVKSAIDSCSEGGEDTLSTAIGMLERWG